MYLRTNYSHPGRITCQFTVALFEGGSPFCKKKTLLLQSSSPFDASLSNKSNLILQLAFGLVGMGKECPKAAWVNAIGRHHSWIQFTSLWSKKFFENLKDTKCLYYRTKQTKSSTNPMMTFLEYVCNWSPSWRTNLKLNLSQITCI